MPERDIVQLAADSSPPWTVAMHVNTRFSHQVSLTENLDAATAMLRSQVELFLNKARHEAQQSGGEMACTQPYMVSMHTNLQFHYQVSMAENMDAATSMVRSQIESSLNKARDEAQQQGIDMKCDYLVTY